MRRFAELFLLGSIALFFGSCASSSTSVRKPRLVPQQALSASTMAINREERSTARQEYVGIYDFAGDDWTSSWEPLLPSPATSLLAQKKESAGTVADTSRYGTLKKVRGFRVQLANVTDERRAKRIEKRAYSLFDNVYVVFRSPSYKVRGGDFTRRSEADAAAREARRMGFRGAWVVPDQVNTWVGGPPPPRDVAEEKDSGKGDGTTDTGLSDR